MNKDALSIINRQKAEIEFLSKTITNNAQTALDVTLEEVESAKTEAIKEFAERLKFNVTGIPWCEYDPVHREIDRLVKEMVGDPDA